MFFDFFQKSQTMTCTIFCTKFFFFFFYPNIFLIQKCVTQIFVPNSIGRLKCCCDRFKWQGSIVYTCLAFEGILSSKNVYETIISVKVLFDKKIPDHLISTLLYSVYLEWKCLYMEHSTKSDVLLLSVLTKKWRCCVHFQLVSNGRWSKLHCAKIMVHLISTLELKWILITTHL